VKVEFLSRLQVSRSVDDENTWRLEAPLRIALDSNAMPEISGAVRWVPLGDRDGRFELTVPAGYVTDFASVPRLPLAYLLAGNTAQASAVVHDFLYEMKAPRAWADDVFAAAMEAEGVAAWRRGLMWSAVRLFGRSRHGKRAPEALR